MTGSFVEFKIYISLKRRTKINWKKNKFCRIQNLHISQTVEVVGFIHLVFCRIQNLHISQTIKAIIKSLGRFVEFKIYISLKPQIEIWRRNFEFGYKKMDRHRSRPEGNLDKIFI